MSGNSNWRLAAISKAALAGRSRTFTLKNGVNRVGKSGKFEVKVRSVLCSRNHCKIIVDGDKLTVQDTSCNGTYINDRHYQQATTKTLLAHNDIISFGFNISTVYDIKDKNAYIYRVIKDDVDPSVIAIGDSDEDDDIDHNVVVVVDSESDDEFDGEFDGDERVKNINYMSDNSADEDGSDEDEQYSGSDLGSMYSNDSGAFVVTDTIVNDGPVFDVDDDDEIVKTDRDESIQCADSGQLTEIKTASEISSAAVDDTSIAENSEAHNEKFDLKKIDPRIERIKRNIELNRPKGVALITAKPLRKRRKTVTEREYEDFKMMREQRKKQWKAGDDECKRMRLEKLAQIALESKSTNLTNQCETSKPREPFVPKVKCAQISRGELLTTEMLADSAK